MNTKEQIFRRAKEEGRTVLTEIESKEVFNSVGIKTVARMVLESVEIQEITINKNRE